MMKKTIISTVLMVCLLASFTLSAFATGDTPTVAQANGFTTYQHDNGTYTVVSPIIKVDDGNQARGTTKTTTGTRSATNYNSDDNSVNWVFTIYGTFSYEEGVSCVCTNSTYSQEIKASGWSFSNGNAWYEGNVAYASGTFKHKILFITNETIDVSLHIGCDTYGNFIYD